MGVIDQLLDTEGMWYTARNDVVVVLFTFDLIYPTIDYKIHNIDFSAKIPSNAFFFNAPVMRPTLLALLVLLQDL